MSYYKIIVKRTVEQSFVIEAKDPEEAEQLAGLYGELILIQEVKGGKGDDTSRRNDYLHSR